MKKIILGMAAFLCFALDIQAQKTPLEKYELVPEDYEHIYLDMVQFNPWKRIKSGRNEYMGQVANNDILYGYGLYMTADGREFIGKFRQGKMLFGITIGKEMAIVGSPNYYASYSLTTGKLDYVFRVNEKVVVDAKYLDEYRFVRMKYANGDEYMGETYQGKRHGYGIYYYHNGDRWFGQYKNDVRDGFGALFCADNSMKIGQWKMEDEPRVMELIELEDIAKKKK